MAGVVAIPRITGYERKASSLRFARTYLQTGNTVLSPTDQVVPLGSVVVSSHTKEVSTIIGRKRTNPNNRNCIEGVSKIVVGVSDEFKRA
jgi:hypothetical protein